MSYQIFLCDLPPDCTDEQLVAHLQPYGTLAALEWLPSDDGTGLRRAMATVESDAPLLGMVDLQYADLRPEKGLYYKLARAGRMRRLFTDDQIAWAAEHPPEETRAWLRGKLVSEHPDVVVGASWDQILLRADDVSPVVRLAMPDPRTGTRATAENTLSSAETSEDLITGLQRLLGQ